MLQPGIIDIKNKLFADITTIPDALKQSYYPFLDGMRAFAITSVILCHVFRDTKWLVFIDGGIGVHVFFILSGFLITTLLLKEKIKYGTISYKNFYIRRALRIFPVAYLFLFVLLILNTVFKLGITTKSFAGAILYLKNFPISSDWYTGHFWTLSIEEQFYLFGPVMLLSNTNRYIILTLILFVTVPALNYIGFHNVGFFYTSRLVHVITFIFLAVFDRGALYILSGSLLSILIFKGIIKSDRLQGRYYLSFVLFVSAATVHFLNIPYFSAIVFDVLIMLVIALNLNQNNFLTAILSNRILVKIGILSYSLYIWQQIFTVYQPWNGYFKYAGSPFLNIPALFITAWLSYTFYERTFLKLKTHFSKKETDAETIRLQEVD